MCFMVACSVLSAMLSLHHDEAVCHLAIALVDPLLVLTIPGTHCIHACISYTSDSYVCSSLGSLIALSQLSGGLKILRKVRFELCSSQLYDYNLLDCVCL